MASVEVTGLVKSYGKQPVLTGLDVTVADGSFTAILGTSGSGKTTLLRVIAGFERVDAGAVRIGGVIVDDGRTRVPPQRRRIGYVPQDGALFPHLTVLGNVSFGLRREQRSDGRVKRTLEMVGIGALGERYPHQLSGGQQQRVALARALVIEPRVVLLDEPFSSLDASLRASVRSDVRDVLREAQTTTILVTHDQDEALSLADHVAVLRDGAVVQSAPPAELYDRPLDVDLARFLGEGNLLHAAVTRGAADTVLGPLPVVDAGLDGPVVVMLRPEQVEVVAGGESTVVSCEYYGHDALLRISVGDQVLTARVPGDHAYPPGTKVAVRGRGAVMAWPAV